MAITYKSQGSGVSTETSGAALSPLCPTTVDAGDILVAHVFWESNVTSPSTPSGWTLLDGPRNIETSVARQWIFGRIADGTEDGAAVAFGSPAVTTQRGARVYSFAGRVGGTITELVTGFAFLSHATDPQMPSVTTSVTGALAVACVGQNDNNSAGSATGESGGDWVEATAEYTAALTPGLMLQIQTATPTADPGTISGGSVATTNDPCGVTGFQIRPSNNQSVTPGLATLATARFTPIIALAILASTASLVTTRFTPTVLVEAAGITVIPGTVALTTTRLTPTVLTPRVTVPGVVALTTSRFTPTVLTPAVSIPGVVALVATRFTPTVLTPVVTIPGTRAGILTRLAPATVLGTIVIPGTVATVTTRFAPAVNVTNNVTVTPGTRAAVTTRYTPDTLLFTTGGPIFLYTAANWAAGLSFYFEVTMRTSVDGGVYAQLFNTTTSTPVSGSLLTTTGSTMQRLRSGALTLTDGNTYRVQLSPGGSAAGKIVSARLIVV